MDYECGCCGVDSECVNSGHVDSGVWTAVCGGGGVWIMTVDSGVWGWWGVDYGRGPWGVDHECGRRVVDRAVWIMSVDGVWTVAGTPFSGLPLG